MKIRQLLALCALASGAVHAQTADYTLADVAQHATQSDCWMVLNSNKVYDVTSYLGAHPAGANVMLPYCGQDGTQAFASVGHSSSAVRLEANYLIGNLVAGTLPISVSLAPMNANVTVGGTIQFTPTVQNSTQGVAWTVAPAALGSISASGLFTATTAGQGTVTATSTEDTSVSASATVTVSESQGGGGISISLTPSAVTLNAGARQRFVAQVANSDQGVTWSVTGSIGTINQYGVLRASATAGTGTVVATSVADPTQSASAQVIVNAVNCVPPPRRGHGDHDD